MITVSKENVNNIRFFANSIGLTKEYKKGEYVIFKNEVYPVKKSNIVYEHCDNYFQVLKLSIISPYELRFAVIPTFLPESKIIELFVNKIISKEFIALYKHKEINKDDLTDAINEKKNYLLNKFIDMNFEKRPPCQRKKIFKYLKSLESKTDIKMKIQ